jgi:hypothetical protein
MRRLAFNLMLVIALLLQGVVAVGGSVSADHGQEQHCAGHDVAAKDCACCPDGGTASMSCTTQCSAIQAPQVILAPVRLAIASTLPTSVPPVFAGPNYAPLVPPPIA